MTGVQTCALPISCGMLLFLRGRSIGTLWACCGALAYAANSQFVTWIYHRWALGAFCWVPWILWAIDRYRHGKRCSWPLVPVFIGMAFLGGTLQHAALVVLVVAAMWIEETWNVWTTRSMWGRHLGERSSSITNAEPGHFDEESLNGHQGKQPSPWFSQVSVLGRYATCGMLGVGLAAMMFIPCSDAFLTSMRLGLHTGLYGNASNGVYPHGWLQPLFNLAAYPLQIFPSVLGRCDSVDLLKLFRSELFYVAYFGSLPVWIALLAIFRKQAPLLARLLIVTGLFLPLTPLVRYLYQRLFLLFILGGILAFVHFMESATRETKLRIFRITAMLTCVCLAAWTGMNVLLLAKPAILAQLRENILSEGSGSSFGFFSDWIAGRADRFIHDLFIWSPQQLAPLLFFGLALAGLRWTASVSDGWRRKGAWLVALAVFGEVSLFGSHWVVWTDPNLCPLFPATPETVALQKLVGHNGRVTTLMHPTAHMACTPFIPNTLSPYGIATISGYDSIVPNGMVLPNESAGDAGKLGRFGVSHLVTWPGNPDVATDWKLVWKSPSMELYENTLGMPRAMGFQTSADKDAFFEGAQPHFLTVDETSGKENSRSLEVPKGTRWIRIAENQADGWEYRTAASAAWQPVRRAVDASMLLENQSPQDATRVEMRYNPPLRKLGFMVSAASLAILAIGQWVTILARRKSV